MSAKKKKKKKTLSGGCTACHSQEIKTNPQKKKRSPKGGGHLLPVSPLLATPLKVSMFSM